MPRRIGIFTALMGFVALMGCEIPQSQTHSLQTESRPQALVMPTAAPDQNAVRSFQNIELRLRAQGRLRTERQPTDAPFGASELIRDFVNIALFQEFSSSQGQFTRRRTQARLAKWQAPVVASLHFGGHLSGQDRNRLLADTQTVLRNISAATRHPVSLGRVANMHIFVVSEAERRALGPIFRSIAPRMLPGHIQTLTNLSPNNYCAVMAFTSGSRPSVYDKAIVIIRAELSPFMQRSCLHEEIAQGLGLPNDSPSARPSVFNDDEEFALLTLHDFMLLEILYNPALVPGMSLEQAAPIAARLAQKKLPGAEPIVVANARSR